jgi:LacI family transcriptional regulator
MRSTRKNITTIKDVAREAGVSTATVSRVFNNLEPVDDRTRQHVRRVAREMRYVPNATGRSLSRRKTEAIGMILPDLFGEFFSEVLRGSDQTAQRSNHHLVVSSSHNDKKQIRAALTMMRGRVDGLVIMSPHIDVETLNEYLPQTLPVVLLNCGIHAEACDSLNVDNVGGAYAMTKHLISHGHRRIGIIKGVEGNSDSRGRLQGYVRALEEAGIMPDARLQVPGAFSEASGFDAVREMLSLDPRPTAIFASNDAMAIGALSALRDCGIHVPEEIALAGFDDTPIAGYMTPSLTTVKVDIFRLGVLAIETALHAARNQIAHKNQQIILQTTLSLRESCGCTDPTPIHANAKEQGGDSPQINMHAVDGTPRDTMS